MLPLADTHVHLLAGLDDGPETVDEAVAMCRFLVEEGVQHATALAHQNPHFPENLPERMLPVAAELQARLREEQIPLTVYPTGEIMLGPQTTADWFNGHLLSYGNSKSYLLVEQPHSTFLDLHPLASVLQSQGVRIVIAHAERYGPLVEDSAYVESLIAVGCLVQVTADALLYPHNVRQEKAVKDWAKRGMIHLLGSDGHGLDWREPRMKEGFETILSWIGEPAAEQIAQWGVAVLQGQPVTAPKPTPKPLNWFARLFQ